jgi:hypothetical protein
MNKDEGPSVNRYKQDLEALKDAKIDDSNQYVEENGTKYRLPYKMIKEVVFAGVSQAEMIDAQHAARLQYRLLLLDPVIKAWVNFVKGRITIIYNPTGADNIREKMSFDDIVQFLDKEGVHVGRQNAAERDYDYYKEFYAYAFNPKTIREHAPYGYTDEQWKKMKPGWEKRQQEGRKKKWEQFKEYQDGYEKLHPEIYGQRT